MSASFEAVFLADTGEAGAAAVELGTFAAAAAAAAASCALSPPEAAGWDTVLFWRPVAYVVEPGVTVRSAVASGLLAAEFVLAVAIALEVAGRVALAACFVPLAVLVRGFAPPAAGAFAVAAVVFAGTDALASSKAAKGCESLSWLDVDACARGGDVSETAAATSDAILGILGTAEPLQAT